MTTDLKQVNALTKTYDLLLWIIPQLEKLPRSQKFMLGDRIEGTLLDVMDLIIQAVYTKNKTAFLKDANLKIEKLRYLIRLIMDLKYFSITKYEYISRSLNEIGAEIGGWIRYQQGKDEKAQ
ncbi:MAG: hypothetical protein HW390_1312 [Candidatus Brocadiaceae bacterium]|nr:hypothetical protein [Candidatus Brocadiaceae bacterium]